MAAYAYAAAYPGEVHRLVLSESVIPGFGLEESMNPATGGYWHLGFHMQVEIAAGLTRGHEAFYLGHYWKTGSVVPNAITPAEQMEYLRTYAAPGGMRAGFQHCAALLEDGAYNRANFGAKLTMPVLVLNGAKGIPQEQTVSAVRRVASDVRAEIIPNAGHAIGEDQPSAVAERILSFLSPAARPANP